MLQRVYIETTIVSYLTARPSRDLIIAAHQQITHEWWDSCRGDYDLCASEVVIREAGAGDPEAAQERLDILQSTILVQTRQQALELAEELVKAGALPAKASEDALHIAIAADEKIPYLLTWNLRHMANATMRPLIESVCASKGYKARLFVRPRNSRRLRHERNRSDC